MSGRGFASVGYVAAIAAAALSCYLVSLRVASERAELEKIESEIVAAQRDIRLLQTEIGTRGRLAQLERWNVKVLALSAPKAEQFLDGGFALARLTAPRKGVDLQAPVVLASAPAPKRQTPLPAEPEAGQSPRSLLHTTSLKLAGRDDEPAARPKPASAASKSATAKPAPASPDSKSVGKPAKPNTNGDTAKPEEQRSGQ